jgi:hypothetical protein
MNASETGRSEVSTLMERILYEVKKIVVGQDRFLERGHSGPGASAG